MYSQDKIPGAYQIETGTIIVPEQQTKQEHIVTYARVSSTENKTNLIAQSKRLQRFCRANGWVIHENITEIGSGLNDKRRKLTKLLEDGKITKLVVEHKDRLSRFGVNFIEIYCRKIGCELIVINQTSTEKEDLITDFIAVITSFCARIYGLRRKSRKTEQFIAELENEKAAISRKNSD